ncbi:MAG: SCO family protein [Flavobacteriaceae bacterium]|nr:SCO family protein [Flavobacteriaceae bacterium]
MLQFFKKYKYFGVTLLIISSVIISIIYSILKPKKILPIYQPAQVSTALVDSTIQYKKKYHKIGNFKLVNQNGDTITEATYDNKIYVADFFFTTCGTICPIMTKNMHSVQKAILMDKEVMLISHSVTPKIDTVEQLKRYAKANHVNSSKWNLVTGDKKQIYELARKSYLAVKTNGDGGPFDMIHTENFILIDKEKRIRGFYDGTNLEDIDRLMGDISILKSSYIED